MIRENDNKQESSDTVMEQHKSVSDKIEAEFLTCERIVVFVLLMVTAGMMGAYTFVMRGGVFCNAQTANIVMMGIAFGKKNWELGFYFLIPIAAYCGGAILSEVLPHTVRKTCWLRWDTCLIAIEIVILFLIGWIPLSLPDQIVQILINFIASMQYNIFRQAEGIPMATTFCTNHVRQVGVCLAKILRGKGKDRGVLHRGLVHLLMLTGFFTGACVLTIFCAILKEKAIWIAIIPMMANFVLLLYADLVKEHDLLWKVPRGH